jgi:hypothetical protein
MNDQGDQLFGQGTEGEREHRARKPTRLACTCKQGFIY